MRRAMDADLGRHATVNCASGGRLCACAALNRASAVCPKAVRLTVTEIVDGLVRRVLWDSEFDLERWLFTPPVLRVEEKWFICV